MTHFCTTSCVNDGAAPSHTEPRNPLRATWLITAQQEHITLPMSVVKFSPSYEGSMAVAKRKSQGCKSTLSCLPTFLPTNEDMIFSRVTAETYGFTDNQHYSFRNRDGTHDGGTNSRIDGDHSKMQSGALSTHKAPHHLSSPSPACRKSLSLSLSQRASMSCSPSSTGQAFVWKFLQRGQSPPAGPRLREILPYARSSGSQ